MNEQAIPMPHRSADKINLPRISVPRSLVLVGMMGSGKSKVGKYLARWLDLPFCDSDTEIEQEFGLQITEIFAEYGEAKFREQEVKIMRRLLAAAPQVISTGGGAFINNETRAAVKANAISIWLDVPIDELMERVKRRPTRPLLQHPNPREIMENLLEKRRPIYAEADIRVAGDNAPAIVTAERAAQQLIDFLATL